MAASKVKSWYNKFHSIATACFDTACFLGAEEEILFLQDPLKLSQQGFKGFKSEDFVVVELPADRDCQVEAPPPPPQPKRRRDRGEWAQYSPEDDDYDMTASTRPPQSGEEHVADLQAVNQILHLAGRVTAGGEIHVIQHYAKVIQDMEANLSSAGRALLRQQTRGDANHVRKPSLATASTCTDEDWESVETVVEVEDEDDWLLLNVQL
ncbi:unnamed protein product [Symbiodinium natans]|uniref:Uncharacterized protein n=1 Tax=Symbiodinium natans TaxID=878477 RepID=A0A812RCX8_9DINO|nr:unnamed protein product [Symbiodinium natans]